MNGPPRLTRMGPGDVIDFVARMTLRCQRCERASRGGNGVKERRVTYRPWSQCGDSVMECPVTEKGRRDDGFGTIEDENYKNVYFSYCPSQLERRPSLVVGRENLGNRSAWNCAE